MGEQSNISTWATCPDRKETIMHVTNMNSPRTGKPVTNQFIITDGDVTVFQSYNSTIATIDYDAGTITIGEDWDYSVTTGRYRNLFFEDEEFSDLASKAGILAALESDGYVTDDYCNEFIVTLA